MNRSLPGLAMMALVLGGPVVGRPVSQPVAVPSLQRLADMPTPRAAHSATLLDDGNVLLAGGCFADGCENGIAGDALVFDAERHVFEPSGKLVIARVGHRAIKDRDGSVLLLGGWTAEGAASVVERYDPAHREFSAHGRLLQARDGFTATMLDDGTILVVGGYAGAMQRLASAELYDPRTGSSTAVGAMATPRMSHTATLLDDGKVLIAGGSSSRSSLLDSLEVYDPRTRTFSAAGHLARARHKHAAVRVGKSVLLIGGAGLDEATQQFSDSERWQPGQVTTSPGPTMHEPRYKFADSVVSLADDATLISGGGSTPEILRTDPLAFTATASGIGRKLSFASGTRLANGDVLVAGGYDTHIHTDRGAWLLQNRH